MAVSPASHAEYRVDSGNQCISSPPRRNFPEETPVQLPYQGPALRIIDLCGGPGRHQKGASRRPLWNLVLAPIYWITAPGRTLYARSPFVFGMLFSSRKTLALGHYSHVY